MISAGNNRMRPIAMTTFAAIFALMPLAMNIGAGSEMLQPLAIAIVSGLVVQIPLVLIVLPGFLQLFNRKIQAWSVPNKLNEADFLVYSLAPACRVDKPGILFDRKTCRWISTINRLMRAARRAILAFTSYYNRALEGYGKHTIFTYTLLDGLRNANYNKTQT